MQKLKVIYDVNLGTGLNLLCLAGAGLLTIRGIVEWKKYKAEEGYRKLVKAGIKAAEDLEKLIGELDKVKLKDAEE